MCVEILFSLTLNTNFHKLNVNYQKLFMVAEKINFRKFTSNYGENSRLPKA